MNIKFIFASLAACVSLSASAYDLTEGNVYYDIISAGQVAVTYGDVAYSGYVNIPDQVTHNGVTYQVTAIGDRAFNACTEMTGVRLSKQLKTIGAAAFASCSKLSIITLPDVLTTLGEAAFCSCSNLVSINLPASLTSIGSEAFMRCSRLESITVSAANPNYSTEAGVLYNKAKTTLIAFPNGKASTFTIPSSVTTIGPAAFAYCPKLTEIVVPGTVKTIGDAAFYGCPRLSDVTLASGITTIGLWAFAECDALQQVTVPATVSSLSDEAFSFCSELKNVYVSGSNGNYVSDNGVVFDAGRKQVIVMPGAKSGAYTLPSTVTSINNHAFYGSDQLTSLTIPSSVTSISGNPFVLSNGLKAINVDSKNANYASADGVLLNKSRSQVIAFPNSKAGAYSVPATVKTISAGAFARSIALEQLNLPNGLTTISDWAFMGCSALESINIPYSVTTLGSHALADCHALRLIVMNGQPKAVSAFANEVYQQAQLFVPEGLQSSYKATSGWTRFNNVLPYGVLGTTTSIVRGVRQSVPVSLNTNLPITALSLKVVLPSGLQVSNDTGGLPLAKLLGDAAETHTIQCTGGSKNSATFLIMSNDNSQLTNTAEEPLFNFMVDVEPNTSTGLHSLTLQDITMTYAGTMGYAEAYQQPSTSKVNISSYLGDVNHDSQINVTDVVEIQNYLLGHPTATFHASEADVNQNNEISVTDAVETINLIQREPFLDAAAPLWVSSQQCSDKLFGDTTKGKAGDILFLHIFFNNERRDFYTAHQFEILLPEGMELYKKNDGSYIYVPSQRYSNQSFYIKEIENATQSAGKAYSIVSTSMDLSTISLSSGDLITLAITTSRTLPDAYYKMKLRNVVFAGTDASQAVLDDSDIIVQIGTPSGIDAPEQQPEVSAHDVYNLQGVRVRTAAQSLQGLPAGVYVVGGKKVMVK